MRSTFIKTAVAALALLATPFAASAADVPIKGYYKSTPRSVVPYFSWTGFYVGINGGWGQSKADWAFSTTGQTLGYTANGPMIGATLGYNYQIGSWVFGLEGDWDWANIKGSTNCPVGPTFSCGSTTDSIATIRGRVGYAWNTFLLYGTAGYGFDTTKININGPAFDFSQSKMMSGLVYGVGLEYAFLSNWSAKLEYLYADFGAKNYSDGGGGSVSVHAPISMIRAGLNYKFNGPLFSRF